MRGDSLRDFYAKTLALLGLALVGALGALVDHWPTTQPLPKVSERLQLQTPMLADAAIPVEDAIANLPALEASGRPVAESAPVPDAYVQPALVSIPIASASALLGRSMNGAFDAPPPPMAPIAAQPVTSLPASEVVLSLPEPTPEPRIYASSHGPDRGEDGFLTDATEVAKRAGNSIVSGTVKTGASIVDGLRSVGGVVRKGLSRFIP